MQVRYCVIIKGLRCENEIYVHYFEAEEDSAYGTIWYAKNIMFREPIGKLVKSIGTGNVIPEWCYEPMPHHWHQSLKISETNLRDILRFIKKIKK